MTFGNFGKKKVSSQSREAASGEITQKFLQKHKLGGENPHQLWVLFLEEATSRGQLSAPVEHWSYG